MKRFLIFFSCLFFFSLCAAADQPLTSSESEARCNTAIDRCAPPPKPAPCPAGKHWTLFGTGIAHCVADDPVCPSGSSIVRDALGNPSCGAVQPPTCNNQQVWNGTSCQARCPSPQRWDDATGCQCPAGQAWSNAASTCVNTGPSCPQDQQYDNATGTCIPAGSCPWNAPQNYPICACPAGYFWDGGTCQPPAGCPSGQTWNGSECVSICAFGETWNGASCIAPNPTCPAGQVWNGSACYLPAQNCQSGQTWNGSACVSVCAAGETWNGVACVGQSQSCPANGPQNFPACACPAGQSWNGVACVGQAQTCPANGPQNPPACACPAGQTWNGSDCVPPINFVCPAGGPQNWPACSCPAGQSWNGATCAPVAMTCPPPTIINVVLWPNGFQKSYTMVEYTPSSDGRSCIAEYDNFNCDRGGRCSQQ